MKNFEVEENWSWRRLKLKKFEVGEIWNSRNLKLKKFVVEEVWSWSLGLFSLFGLYSYFWRVWIRSKSFSDLLMYPSNFGVGNTTVSFCLVWPRMGCFCPCWALHQDIFGVRVRFNNFIVTYLRRLSTLVLKVQTYLIILIWTHLGVFLALFRPFGAIFGLGWGPNPFLGPTYIA